MDTLRTQDDLDALISDLRDAGYPYLGSQDCTWTLLPSGEVQWQAPGPYGEGETVEDWTTVQSQEELHESVQAWRYDY